MLCDELEKFDAASNADLSAGYYHRYAYEADEVDAAIAELKKENERLKDKLRYYPMMAALIGSDNKEIRRLKRALWLARAERALEKIAWFKLWNASISTMNPEDGARQEYDKWKKSLGKFIKKAEEYR